MVDTVASNTSSRGSAQERWQKTGNKVLSGVRINKALHSARVEQAERTRQIGAIYQTLPSYSSKNAECYGRERFSGINNVPNRMKTWWNEEYYIVKCDWKETLITMLDIAIIIAVMVISVMIYLNDLEVTVAPKNGKHVDPNTLKEINMWNGRIMAYAKIAVGALVCSFKAYGLYKRTTLACRTNGYPAYAAPEHIGWTIAKAPYRLVMGLFNMFKEPRVAAYN